MRPVKLRQHYRLNKSEALFRPAFQVIICLLQVQAVKEFPSCITQIEKGSIDAQQEALIITYSKLACCCQIQQQAYSGKTDFLLGGNLWQVCRLWFIISVW